MTLKRKIFLGLGLGILFWYLLKKKTYTESEKKSIIADWENKNAELGRMLGYPECCVKAFCNNPPELIDEVDREELETRVNAAYINGQYTGFIPCKKHAIMVTSGQIKLTDLIKNRSSLFPNFPNV